MKKIKNIIHIIEKINADVRTLKKGVVKDEVLESCGAVLEELRELEMSEFIEAENIREQIIVESFTNIIKEKNYEALENMLENYEAFIPIR